MTATRAAPGRATADGPPGTATTPAPEAAHRRRLGIPDDARRVLVLSESSHWDPDWMLTAEQYFRLGVRRTLDKVLDELAAAPRRVWGADCIFFLAMYWERRPERRDELVELVNHGRIRLTTSGVTTQDTLLPTTESVLRDFLVGQEWLRARGMTQEPRLAYFPDSFGHSPALPSLLRSAGFDRTMVTRIDGGYFVGADWERPGRFPRPGSSAETLTAAGSADFVWRDATGAEVLAHWNPFTYGQGDMVASVGALRYMSAPTAVPDRAERRVAARLEKYARQLEPLARTPYLLCPVGLDFTHPVPGLVDLLDRYNERRYPDTGLWVLNAAADDYLDLVDAHRDALPVVEMDPNPYWTGFYASRPELKRAHRGLVGDLLAAEAASVAAGEVAAVRAAAALAGPWWTAATANHHDFVTGTSPDRVVRKEQEPWLRSARAAVEAVGAAVGAPVDRAATHTPGGTGPGGPVAARVQVEQLADGTVRVDTGRLRASVDPVAGGCLTSVEVDGRTVPGPVADLVAMADSGGLWRMGHEYRGGHLREVDRASVRGAVVSVADLPDGGAEVTVSGSLDGAPTTRRYRFRPGAAAVGVRSTCSAGDRRTVVLTAPVDGEPAGVVMDQPGGTVRRPLGRIFAPTFWPVSSWIALEGAGPAVAVEMTRAVAVRDRRTVEVVVARNAVKERAWGVVPVPACPARGHEPGPTSAEVVLTWGATDDPLARGADARALLDDPVRARFEAAVAEVLSVTTLDVGPASRPEVEVLALKAADRGEGLVLRLADRSGAGRVACRVVVHRPVRSAARCDVRERDLEDLDVVAADGGAVVEVHGPAVTSVRIVLGGTASP